jgi:hypothetical protein
MSSSLFAAIPRDIFRLLFQYLSLGELVTLEKSLVVNSELSCHYLSSLQGIVLDFIPSAYRSRNQEFDWIIDHGILIQKLTFEPESRSDLLDIFRSTLKSIDFRWEFSTNKTSIIAKELANVGQFSSLTSLCVRYSAIDDVTLTAFLKFHPRLESLDISVTTKLTVGIIPVVTEHCQYLRKLCIGENSWVTDDPISISLLAPGCSHLEYLGLWATHIYQDNTILLLIESFPKLSALYFDIDWFSEKVSSAFLQRVLFRAICSGDPGSQVMALHCLDEYMNLHDTLLAFTTIDFCSLFLREDQSSEVIRRLVLVLTSCNQHSLSVRNTQTAILRFFRRFSTHQALFNQIVEVINETGDPGSVGRLVNLLRVLDGEEVLEPCIMVLRKLFEENSSQDLNPFDILKTLRSLANKPNCPVEAICDFVTSIVSRSATEGRCRDWLLDSEIILDLLTLPSSTSAVILGVTKIIAECVAINDEPFIDYLLNTWLLLPFLAEQHRNWPTHVLALIKIMVSFRSKYLFIFQLELRFPVDYPQLMGNTPVSSTNTPS